MPAHDLHGRKHLEDVIAANQKSRGIHRPSAFSRSFFCFKLCNTALVPNGQIADAGRIQNLHDLADREIVLPADQQPVNGVALPVDDDLAVLRGRGGCVVHPREPAVLFPDARIVPAFLAEVSDRRDLHAVFPDRRTLDGKPAADVKPPVPRHPEPLAGHERLPVPRGDVLAFRDHAVCGHVRYAVPRVLCPAVDLSLIHI